MRLAWLGHTPPGLWFDEARNIDQFASMLDGDYRLEFFDQEPLYVLFLAMGFALKGMTPVGLRLASAIAGILTIPAAFWALRRLYGRRIATWCCLLLAVLPWHIIFSRLGFRAVTAPLMQVLCIGLALRALSRPRIGNLLALFLAGFAGMFSYLPFLPTPLFLAIYAWCASRHSVERHRRVPLVAVTLFAVYVAYIPATMVLHRTAGAGIAHARITSEKNYTAAHWRMRGGPPDNLVRTLGMFCWRGDSNPRHNIPGAPQIPALLFPLLLLGVARELRVRNARSFLVLAWFGAGLLPTILSLNCPHATRAICSALPACILIARGGALTLTALVRLLGKLRLLRIDYWPGLAGCLLTAWGVWQYFYVYGRSYAVWEAFQSASVEAAAQLKQLPRGSIVLQDPFENGTYSFDVLTRLNGIDVRKLRAPADVVSLAPPPPAPFYYIAVGRDHFGIHFLQNYPAAARQAIFSDPRGRPTGVLFRVR
jgi:hypothetical protein